MVPVGLNGARTFQSLTCISNNWVSRNTRFLLDAISSPSFSVDLAQYVQFNFTATFRFLANVSSEFPITLLVDN